jgi:hypothetical protein
LTIDKSDTDPTLALALEDMPPFEKADALDDRSRFQIGVGRALPEEAYEATEPPSPQWVDVEGGKVAQFDLTSPGATAMRVVWL